ncbi:hypothetical protein C0033_08855 [Clostridium sp. chh4-2]|uniref:hypothetical protein n=1 Tax=Clostridium sp. chh4-2 TaxID=2067550 RepID=UPI000CCE12A6|nr:hypothetical protein [Clostridium sp. chh4-2]PNV62212.1 hypothetical protein C0033_08855 [Clostridium sp. chh4-2]
MDKSKFYTVEKEFNGKKYVAQFSGVSAAVRAIDSSYIDGTSTTSTEKLGQYILDNIIVDPKGLTADDFETLEEYNTVTTWGRDVMYGKFRNGANASTGKAKS